MFKRNLAILVLAGALVGGGTYAWAQTSDTSPAAPSSTAAPSSSAPAAHRGAGRGGWANDLLGRVVHGDLVVRDKQGYANVTYDRGKEDGVSDNTLTITRPDGKQVSFKLTSGTKYKGVHDASQLQAGKPTVVVSKDGNALVVAQRAGTPPTTPTTNGSSPAGQQ